MNIKKVVLYCFLICTFCSILRASSCPIPGGTPEAAILFLRAAKTNTAESPDCIVVAIHDLHHAQSQDAINILVDYLDFRRPHIDNDLIWSSSMAEPYPAVSQLFSIGQAAVPALVRILANSDVSALIHQNALTTIMLIYRDDPPAGVEVLSNEAVHSKDAKQAMLLRQASTVAAQKCPGKYRNQCEFVLNKK
jgi:hypothetical protein